MSPWNQFQRFTEWSMFFFSRMPTCFILIQSLSVLILQSMKDHHPHKEQLGVLLVGVWKYYCDADSINLLQCRSHLAILPVIWWSLLWGLLFWRCSLFELAPRFLWDFLTMYCVECICKSYEHDSVFFHFGRDKIFSSVVIIGRLFITSLKPDWRL